MSEVCPVCNSPIAPQQETCSTCGYRFLGATQKFKPVDVNAHEVPAVPIKKVSSATLRVIRGPQIETIFYLKDERTVVGRNPQCEIFLNDMTVSREHAEIAPDHNGFIITDLNSYNGIWINNENVDSHHLNQGDIVQIGVFCLIYEENQ